MTDSAVAHGVGEAASLAAAYMLVGPRSDGFCVRVNAGWITNSCIAC